MSLSIRWLRQVLLDSIDYDRQYVTFEFESKGFLRGNPGTQTVHGIAYLDNNNQIPMDEIKDILEKNKRVDILIEWREERDRKKSYLKKIIYEGQNPSRRDG